MSNVVRVISIFVVIFVALTIFGSMFGVASGKFSLTSWLQKFEESQFGLNVGDALSNKLFIDEDWGAFNWFRGFINGLTGLIGTFVSIIQFAVELIVFAFNLLFDIPVS